MAVTKIHAIKAAVSDAVAYICNEKKTRGESLVTSFATSPETAEDDFRFTLSHTNAKDPNKAYHLIQSFLPGEVDGEEAHKIGIELADRLLMGKYSYIVATHVDRGHIHNHIIFCAADNIDYKKYHSCTKSYWEIRNVSDEICLEHGLSVLLETAGDIKKKKKKREPDTLRAKLKKDIGECIKEARDYEHFLQLMMKKGYQIAGAEFGPGARKYIDFLPEGGERWIRGRATSLGENYTKEAIRFRIEHKGVRRVGKMKKKEEPKKKELIDTSQEAFRKNKGLERWANLKNLQTAAGVYSELSGMGIHNEEDLEEKITELREQARAEKKKAIAIQKKVKGISETVHYARVYDEKREYALGYKNAKNKEKYYEAHSYDIHLAWGAEEILRSMGIDPSEMSLEEIEGDYQNLKAEKKEAIESCKALEQKAKDIENAKELLLSYFGVEQENEKEGDTPIGEKDMDGTEGKDKALVEAPEKKKGERAKGTKEGRIEDTAKMEKREEEPRGKKQDLIV